MEDNIIYNWILIIKKGSIFDGKWSKAKDKPPCGTPEIYEWIKWGKELPPEIDEDGNEIMYVYKNKKLSKK